MTCPSSATSRTGTLDGVRKADEEDDVASAAMRTTKLPERPPAQRAARPGV